MLHMFPCDLHPVGNIPAEKHSTQGGRVKVGNLYCEEGGKNKQWQNLQIIEHSEGDFKINLFGNLKK